MPSSPRSTRPSVQTVSAPARVNLIGEHTDYTGGFVLPVAIPFYTVATVSPAAEGYHFRSKGFPAERTLALEERSGRTGQWSDYPVGVLRELQELGMVPPPFVLELESDVPLGAGLSSSASVEVATALALLRHMGRDLKPAELALLCQRAENRFVGSPCGIMDQFVVTAAEAGHALLIHTRNLAAEQLPMNVGELANCLIVIVNSDVKHSVAEGEYGTRRRELEAGQAVLRSRFPELRDLGDATPEQLETCRGEIEPKAFQRCRHVVTENARVLAAREAMRAGDPRALGRLIHAAHVSYRDDFEASIEEVDFLVDTAMALPGCFGARLTGGGFGGCTVNLVAAAEAEAFRMAIRRAYRDRYGLDAPVYVCEAVDGAVRRNGPQAAEREVSA